MLSQFYYSNNNDKSETYLKLESLSLNVRKSWVEDSDQTDSMKEIIEIIDGMLIMTSLEDYFLNNKTDLDYFMGEFSKEVLTYTLNQPVIFGENGDEIGMDLIYHFVKLFMKFHQNKEYAPLFEKIRKIFSKDNSNSFFNPQERSMRKEINPKKLFTYQQFNEEFCKNFEKEKKSQESFQKGEKVDVLIKNKSHRFSLDKNFWTRGIISDIKEKK